MKYDKSDMGFDEIMSMLLAEGAEVRRLFEKAGEIKAAKVGEGVYLRGLIEYSNICRKNCLYCGIRRDSELAERYTLTPEEVLATARFALENDYGSIVLQGGENNSPLYIDTITDILRRIKSISNGSLGITLSLGEQSSETYRTWFDAGAHRYLLRIETTNRQLFRKLHPDNDIHRFESRLEALKNLREAGYQVGTGVMIGLPGQSVEDLARDLMFMRDLDIDMCGMGPYVLSEGTPLAETEAHNLPSERWRFEMTLKMIASLRILMPDINIAATTALSAIEPDGRSQAISAGANVIMPNITPLDVRGNYTLYNKKTLCADSDLTDARIKYGEWGDSRHYKNRNHGR